MVYDEIERASRTELRELQSDRLTRTVKRAYEDVPFYREALDAAGVEPDEIADVSAIDRLPFTTKADFRAEYPDGLVAVPREDRARLHASSGTTGKPKIVAYTAGDLGIWREVMARSLHAAGVDSADTLQNAYGYGLFTGGLGLHDGGEELGATVIPIGGSNTERQLDFLVDLDSDVLACTPSYSLHVAEALESRGIDPEELALSTVIIGAEPFTDPMRREIEAALDATAIDIYGLSEIIGPGVSIECAEAQEGLHLWEDHFYPEVIDPETGDVLHEGEEGELVLTTLTKEALPVLRYRTGDITSLTYEQCACGRTAVRMGNVTGRTDDLLIVRGANVYPSQLEAAMLDIGGVAPFYRIDLRREESLDTIEITVERHESFDGDIEELNERLRERIESVLTISADSLDIVAPGSIERTTTGKAKRVYDHRERREQ
ncbi:phenylacetate--CoA ligase [Halobacteriales archaeon QH_8_64_26]|nr:MAG: phenylacetate--CoA ligase [Halobacteriales archaeon QH_8_64_26]